jgi:membrane protein insertase Oxa1/YidC/SpoIIIJ
MELQTVDGQGKSTQKIMNWMMPIMMGIFAFMYTSAFSIYMILSSLISIVSTLIINKIVEKKFKKKYATENDGTIRGRVYTPEPVVKQSKKKKKIVDEVGPNDFMSAKVKGKNKHKVQDTDTYHIKDHIRGRLK